jgi:hypothetical protein
VTTPKLYYMIQIKIIAAMIYLGVHHEGLDRQRCRFDLERPSFRRA